MIYKLYSFKHNILMGIFSCREGLFLSTGVFIFTKMTTNISVTNGCYTSAAVPNLLDTVKALRKSWLYVYVC